MSAEVSFTKENLDTYFKELGKVFRKLNGTKTPAEIMLVGGAAILAGYGFREVTYDVDAVIIASSAMKDAINRVSDKFGLPNDWLNAGVKRTGSFTDKLLGVSVYYKTFSNIITVRMVSAEYLVAMKMKSGRQYKYDMSDIVGILWEHNEKGCPITREAINKAVVALYGESAEIPQVSLDTLEDVFSSGDYERLYNEAREHEEQAKNILLDFQKTNPDGLKGENINEIIEQARRKQENEEVSKVMDGEQSVLSL